MKLPFIKHLLFVLISVLVLSSCEKSDTTFKPTGSWKLVGGTDLIIFNSDTDFFDLDRGKESRNGYTLPKAASGFYSYSLSADSIKLQWLLSSSSLQHQYHFKVSKETFTIGNFYQEYNGLGETLTFEKVK